MLDAERQQPEDRPGDERGPARPAPGTRYRVPGAGVDRLPATAADSDPDSRIPTSRVPNPGSPVPAPREEIPNEQVHGQRGQPRAEQHDGVGDGQDRRAGGEQGVASSPCSNMASEKARTRVAGWKIGGSNNRDGFVVSASAIQDSRHMLNSVS